MSLSASSAIFSLLITCADGLELPLQTELDSFGVASTILRTGRVSVSVSLAQFYHICLYSRVASRVLLPLGDYRFARTDNAISEDIPEALYRFALGIDWTTWFGVEDTFAIRLSLDKRVSANQQFATLRIKDAIADRFMTSFARRPNVDSKHPDFSIMAHVGIDRAELMLDLSGGSLHRRGYRVANTDAPLKENLAAALLYSSGWHLGGFDALIDPMCGSGTFAIEALLMSLNYPVGLDKSQTQFGFYKWQHHNQALWEQTVLAAQDAFHHNLTQPLPKVYLSDASLTAISAAHKNILASALKPIADKLDIRHQSLDKLPHTLRQIHATNTLIITNPPYGERLGDEALIKPLYQGLGLMSQEHLAGKGTLGVLTNNIEIADSLPLANPQTLRCHNGALTVYFRVGELQAKSERDILSRFHKQSFDFMGEDSNLAPASDFINRLQKNLSHLKKYAKKANVTNLRIYDADLPNFNVAIDVYGENVHIQEYTPPKTIAPEVAKARFNLVLAATRQVLGVNRENVFIKTRAKQSGSLQYRKQGNSGKRYIVKEAPAYFYVNFTDYLDTGLFIDHRPMRQLLADAAPQKTVLNLFAYTCTASVQMALAGAKRVVSVDLSENYLTWGKQNFALNGLYGDMLDSQYVFVAADVFDWIKTHNDKYDVIFIDPPTFSNSKKFFGTFDVQRDHSALINRAMNRLTPTGVLYFSNNFSKFVLDTTLQERYEVQEITEQTTGIDFKKGIHNSFKITHKATPKATIKSRSLDADNDGLTNSYAPTSRSTARQAQPTKAKPVKTQSATSIEVRKSTPIKTDKPQPEGSNKSTAQGVMGFYQTYDGKWRKVTDKVASDNQAQMSNKRARARNDDKQGGK